MKNEQISIAEIYDCIEKAGIDAIERKADILLNVANIHTLTYPDDIRYKKESHIIVKDNVARDAEDSQLKCLYSKDGDNDITRHNFLLLDLIETPQTLKKIISALDAAWAKLHGEVDYMELMALTILRNIPDNSILDFITSNITALRLENKPTIKLSSHQKVLDVLFPRTPISRGIGNKNSPVDYFDRIINEVVPQEEKDQTQLGAIYEWNKKIDKEKLVDLIAAATAESIGLRKRWVDLGNEDAILELTKAVIAKLKEYRREPLQTLASICYCIKNDSSDLGIRPIDTKYRDALILLIIINRHYKDEKSRDEECSWIFRDKTRRTMVEIAAMTKPDEMAQDEYNCVKRYADDFIKQHPNLK